MAQALAGPTAPTRNLAQSGLACRNTRGLSCTHAQSVWSAAAGPLRWRRRRRCRPPAAAEAADRSPEGLALGVQQQQQPPLPQTLLRPIQQHPVALTEEGLVPSTASMEAVPPELLPLLEAAVEACSQALGASLVGVYLRGSLAQRGCFLPGVSDADFVVVHLEEQAPGEAAPGAAARLRRSAEQLRADFPHVAKVGLAGCAGSMHHACCSSLCCVSRTLTADRPAVARSQVELKAAPLPHRSPLAALFRQQQKQQQQQGHDATISGVCGSKPGRGGSIAPSALHHHASLAFQLKTQAVCLHGWDLPRLLPDVAALPQLHLLPTLVQEVEAAVRDAARPGAAAPGSSADAAIRGLRWALKRCLRAAFELYLCCSSGAGSAGSSSSSSSSSSPGTVTTTTSSRVFTRDLYWCLEYAARRHPALRPQLAAALQLYVELGPEGSFGGQQMQQAGQAHQEAEQQVQRQHPEQREPPPRQQRLEEAAALAVQLAGRIDLLFLRGMLAEEPGWLAHPGKAGLRRHTMRRHHHQQLQHHHHHHQQQQQHTSSLTPLHPSPAAPAPPPAPPPPGRAPVAPPGAAPRGGSACGCACGRRLPAPAWRLSLWERRRRRLLLLPWRASC